MKLAHVHQKVLCIKTTSDEDPNNRVIKGETYTVVAHQQLGGTIFYKLKGKPYFYSTKIFTEHLLFDDELFTL